MLVSGGRVMHGTGEMRDPGAAESEQVLDRERRAARVVRGATALHAAGSVVVYDARMAARVIRYTAGNENNPADPWGRSELVIRADGSARLDHHFSRCEGAGAWTGKVDGAALKALWAALGQAGFPNGPAVPALAPDSAVRCLTIEGDGGDRGDGGARQVLVGWDQAPSLPGYAEAFGIIDAVIRQLSGAAVGYPASQAAIVTGITGGLTHSSRSAP